MNILVVSLGIKEDGIEGGEQQVISEIYKELIRNGHHVIYITRKSKDEHCNYDKLIGKDIHRFWSPPKNSFLYNLAPLSYILQSYLIARRIQKRRKIDIVNYHHPIPSVGVELALSRRIPRVLTFHAPRFKELKYELTFRNKRLLSKLVSLSVALLEKFIISRSSGVIVLSDFMKNELIQIVPNKLIQIYKIPAGVDTSKFFPISKDKKSELRNELRIPIEPIILFTARRLVPRMGLDNLLQAIALLKTKGINFRLLIAGRGLLEHYLKEKIIEHGLEEKVSMLGYVDDDKLSLYYQASDIFILPTVELEGFGLVILEALATNLPVIGTPVGAIPEVLKTFNPSLVAKTELSNDLALTIMSAISGPKEMNLNQDYYSIISKDFTWTKVSKKYEEVFLKYLKNVS